MLIPNRCSRHLQGKGPVLYRRRVWEMTYAMVCCYSCLRLRALMILSRYPDDTMPTQQSSEEIWRSLHFPLNVSCRILWGVDPKNKYERDPPFRHYQTRPRHTPSLNPLPDVQGPQVIEPQALIHFHCIPEVVFSRMEEVYCRCV